MKKLGITIGVLFGAILVLVFGYSFYYEFYENRALQKEIASYPGYYKELAEACISKESQSCCMSSVRNMVSGNSILMSENDCPEGYQGDLLKCKDSYKWCTPKTVK